MALKEWKNKELGNVLTNKWGFKMDLGALKENQETPIVEEDLLEEEEGKKPDYLDLDKDGDKEESMKDAAEDAKSMKGSENES